MYALKLDNKRFRVKYCPCGKSNKDGKFVPYVGFDKKGYCHSCGASSLSDLPKEFEKESKILLSANKLEPASFIPFDVFKISLSKYEQNHFITYLLRLFGADITEKLISRYFIGTSKHWEGSTVFWQIDSQGKIRTGKIMLYSSATGKRIQEPFSHITWAHTVLKQPEFNLKQCFFGEHLLQGNSKTVAVVESEKTAIIASQYLPCFVWLAVGGLANLSPQRCAILTGRNVILFPDLNGFQKWQEKAKELSSIGSFTTSDLLERKGTKAEKEKGLDLADYLTRFNYKEFALYLPKLA